MARGVARYSERITELLSTYSEEDLRDLVRLHLNAIRGLQYSIDRLNNENEMLKRKLTESDRTGAFYRYHRGAKS